ncbi:(S)-1-Phenylethanol dehydrogenase [Andreprevotia sp. IGB-42]|uniref:SDR family NAD(P)-dependent oxidoreductase n=1 Tax=Andreprevotia sp. IGB-42 TaxID=2497473 RepID=UPI00135AC6F5|nr:SDR family oxidoreductase [Andreprevotia sp. IGB-42]KAF0815168.1 (S)-1-Phenylethanol dehydrogenase [Andreprevotia sp. IGB-42]
MDLQLKGKRAIVTGGSRGIGKAIARQLALEGVDVVIAARNRTALEATARELADETGRRIVPVVADTGNKDAADALVAHAIEALGGIDILVNAAAQPGGISTATALAEIIDDELLLDVDIKVVGYLRTARALAPHLIRNGWGRIINIGGLAIHKTGRPVATLRNVGVAAITKNLADELGPQGINVVAIHPGATRTERTDEESALRAGKANTIGRIVDAAEIADLVAFLASPRTAAINGDAIAAGGGSPGSIHY